MTIEDVPEADAIILLGGGDAARISAVLLYRAHKADFIIIAAGNVPWERARSSRKLRR